MYKHVQQGPYRSLEDLESIDIGIHSQSKNFSSGFLAPLNILVILN